MSYSSKSYNFIFALIVWAVAEVVLQLHGICFWQEHGGTLGWLWSIAIGVIAVWSWLHSRVHFRWWVGGIASLLLLVGPLLQVGAPVVAQIEQRNTQQATVAQRIELLHTVEAQQAASLKTYERNSEIYRGWKPTIDTASAELAATRSNLLDLLTNPPKARVAWLSWTVIIIQLVALILLQVAAIAALGTIRRIRADQSYQPDSAEWPDVPYESLHKKIHSENVAQKTETHSVKETTTKPATTPNEIRARIVSGHYGETPAVRRVMREERRRYQVVGPIFKQLIFSGELQANGRSYRLIRGLVG